jgi:hypothetical protein
VNPRVFLSHATADVDVSRQVFQALRASGFRTFFSDLTIGSGNQWDEVIVREIEQCQVLVVVVSKKASDSFFVKNEVAIAKDLGKPVLPFFIEPEGLCGGLTLFLKTDQGLDGFPGPTQAQLQRLCRHVHRLVGTDAPPSTEYDVSEIVPPRKPGDKKATLARSEIVKRVGLAIAGVVLLGSVAIFIFANKHSQTFAIDCNSLGSNNKPRLSIQLVDFDFGKIPVENVKVTVQSYDFGPCAVPVQSNGRTSSLHWPKGKPIEAHLSIGDVYKDTIRKAGQDTGNIGLEFVYNSARDPEGELGNQ